VKIVEQLVRLFFQETQNKLLYATVDCDNLPSIRILESCGMKIQSEHQEEGIPFLLYCLKREDTPVE
jgi:RimJ/RimL family protein N-acetyltransferase